MGERRPKGEKEYNPLDDAAGLIGDVLSGVVTEPEAKPKIHMAPKAEEKIVSLKKKESIQQPEKPSAEKVPKTKEEMVICKFSVPKAEHKEIKKMLAEVGDILGARVDVSHLGRGWITRILTAQKELIDAALNQEPLKTPNSRDPLSIAEVDHAMATIQSVAFRRAKPIPKDIVD